MFEEFREKLVLGMVVTALLIVLTVIVIGQYNL